MRKRISEEVLNKHRKNAEQKIADYVTLSDKELYAKYGGKEEVEIMIQCLKDRAVEISRIKELNGVEQSGMLSTYRDKGVKEAASKYKTVPIIVYAYLVVMSKGDRDFIHRLEWSDTVIEEFIQDYSKLVKKDMSEGLFRKKWKMGFNRATRYFTKFADEIDMSDRLVDKNDRLVGRKDSIEKYINEVVTDIQKAQKGEIKIATKKQEEKPISKTRLVKQKIEDNAEEIIADLLLLGSAETAKKWDVPPFYIGLQNLCYIANSKGIPIDYEKVRNEMPNRRTASRWTKEEKIKYLEYAKSHSNEEIIKEYGLSLRTVNKYKKEFREYLNDTGNN